MIIEFIVSGMISVGIAAVQAVLPSSPAPIGAVGGIIHAYSFFNTFLPVYETLDAMRTVVEVTVVLGGVYAVFWAIRRLPFGMGGT